MSYLGSYYLCLWMITNVLRPAFWAEHRQHVVAVLVKPKPQAQIQSYQPTIRYFLVVFFFNQFKMT